MAAPGTPTTLGLWLADHRRPVRGVCVAFVLVYLALAVVQGTGAGEPIHVVVVAGWAITWTGLAAQFGWGVPNQVDAWRRSPHGSEPR